MRVLLCLLAVFCIILGIHCIELTESKLIGTHKLPNEWFADVTNAPEKWKLLYRGTDDGFAAADFHERCDSKGPTITLIKTEFGALFGGYTPISWSSPRMFNFVWDPTTFLFSLEGPYTKEPLKINNDGPQHENKHSVKHSAFIGPAFGHDIRTLTM
jgi:hypothetical protein